MFRRQQLAGVLFAVLLPLVVWAGNLVLPFSFQSGTPIRASEMNANFDSVKQAIDGLEGRVSSSGGGVVRSGIRLKLLTTESADGMSMPLTVSGVPVYWDSQLETICYVQWSPYSDTYCTPMSWAYSAFSDPACQNLVAAVTDTADFAPESYGLDGGFRKYALINQGSTDGGAPYAEIGAASGAPLQLYQSNRQFLSDGGYIDTCSAQGNLGRIAPILRNVPLADLARVTAHVR